MRRALALACLAVACSAPAKPRTREAIVFDHPKLLWLDQKAAPWLEQRLEPWPSESVYRADGGVVALGAHLALVGVTVNERWHAVALDEARGAVGIFYIDDTEWVGVDGEDAVYRAREGGAFERARDAAAAVSGEWEERRVSPQAERFAAAGSVVAAAAGDAVYVSVDGARSFRRTVPLAGADVTRLFARHDGVLVVSTWRQGVPEVVLQSRDRGVTWARSSLQTDFIDQLGAWIQADCAEAVLSSDGKTWVKTSDDIDTSPLLRAVTIGEEFVAHPIEPFVNQTTPPAPGPKDAPRVFGEHLCGGASNRTRVPRVRVGSWPVPQCRGVDCLLYRRNLHQYSTLMKIELMSDGLCRRGTERGAEQCEKAEPLVRAPHGLVMNLHARTARVVELPAGCRPVSLRSGAGVAVLVCTEIEENLFVADRRGEWHGEATLPVPEAAAKKELEIADDGTVLFTDEIREHRIREAWVRSPSPLGDRRAWRHLRYPDAVGYTVASSGRVLVATSSSAERFNRLTLLLDEPSLAPRKLIETDLAGRLVRHVCATPGEARVFLQTPERYEVHRIEGGSLTLLEAAPVLGGHHYDAVRNISKDLCSSDLGIYTGDLMNDAQRR